MGAFWHFLHNMPAAFFRLEVAEEKKLSFNLGKESIITLGRI